MTYTELSRSLTMVDLFAGCGGLTSGFVRTGHFTPIGAVEMDREAAATYAQNFGEHIHVGDVADWVAGSLPAADVVVGGPPCQGFSQLGKRDPNDIRSGMWGHYVTALESIRPTYFVMENVPQFLKAPQFEEFSREFHPGGRLSKYRLDPYVLDASLYGASQRRRRAVVVGSLKSAGPVLFRAASRPATVREAWADLPDKVETIDLPESFVEVNGRTVQGAFKLRDLHFTRVPTELAMARYRAIPPGGDRRNLPDELKAPCWRRHTKGSADVMGRLSFDKPSVTIRTEFFKPEKGRYLHPVEHRPITHAEAAAIQGFDENFLWCGSKISIARQIGNAVPPPLARSIAEALLESAGMARED